MDNPNIFKLLFYLSIFGGNLTRSIAEIKITLLVLGFPWDISRYLNKKTFNLLILLVLGS